MERAIFGKYDFEELYENGELIAGVTTDSTDNTYAYQELETECQYKGGMYKFYQYVGSNLKYPKKARREGVQGKVFVEFVVDKAGYTSEVKVIKGIYSECDKQVKTLVETADNFIPAKFKGVPIRQRLILPIIFSL